jgi:PPK2 family polyphosphate:nucleotide phosphotransferase
MGHAHRIEGSQRVQLNAQSTRSEGDWTRELAKARTDELGAEFSELEDLLFYAGQHALLVVFQARDTGGKDGAIRTILGYCNAQSVRTEAFKVPTPDDLAHDFLWRVHARTPGRGEVVLFNRSHYEDVLVARVHKLVPPEVWSKRYGHINHFEELLLDSSTILLKFYLHISKEEQEERLLQREKETEKAWKLSAGDWKERERWDDYTAAYEDALTNCSTPAAPWYLVSADQKWYRDLCVMEQLVETLRPYREIWMERLEAIGKAAKAELREYRKAKNGKGKGLG